MNTERYERMIKIGGKEYPACYTVAAYLYNLKQSEKEGDITKLPASRQYEVTLDMARLYINGAITARNMRNKTNEPLITMDEIMYLATEEELADIFLAVAEITAGGSKQRDVQTEDEVNPSKKAEAAG